MSWAILTASLPAYGEVTFLPGFSNFEFGLWNGQGNITQSQSACILSYVGFFNNRDYRLRASMNAPALSPSTSYRLYNTVDSNFSIPFTLESRDLHAGSGLETLSADVFSSVMTYQGCYFGAALGPNAELTLSILAADMYQVPAGNYQVNMDVEARRVNNGGGITGDGETQTGLLGTVEIPSLIQISRLDDINFGTYDGISPSVAQNEEFCIYTNTSAYTITPSSTTSGANPGSFALDSNGNRIEYSVRVENSANAMLGTELANGEQSSALLANQPTPLSLNCNNSDNAAVYVELLGSEIQAAPAGNYKGVLTLMVAPI